MIYYVLNRGRVKPGENPYRVSDVNTSSRWIAWALRQSDRVFNTKHDPVYIVKDRWPDQPLTEDEIAWIILSATPITELDVGPNVH